MGFSAVHLGPLPSMHRRPLMAARTWTLVMTCVLKTYATGPNNTAVLFGHLEEPLRILHEPNELRDIEHVLEPLAAFQVM